MPESNGFTRLYPLLASKLAEYLKVSADELPAGCELNEVAYRYISRGKPPQQVYAALKVVAEPLETLPLPEPLLQLASIRAFPLFVSTTFDSTLVRAINQQRFGGKPKTQVFAYSPSDELQDIAPDGLDHGDSIVYQIMGKLSGRPTYAVTQEDAIEFFHSLQSEIHRPKNLFHELSTRNLLLMGTRLSGWLTSFLMRMSKQQRLSLNDNSDYVADDTVKADPGLVLFLERFSRGTEIFRDADPIAFIAELHRRWTERHPASEEAAATPAIAPTQQVAPGAVFLSYASENRSAVEKLKQALEQAKVDVFFDREQLEGGNDWNVKLQRNIMSCSLFVPLISKETLTDQDRYFRKEWRAALDRAQGASFDPEHAFLLPVIIDDTPITHRALPFAFASVQASTLPGGEPTPEFVQRVVQLYRKHQLQRTAGAA